jgi:hypothetical protein
VKGRKLFLLTATIFTLLALKPLPSGADNPQSPGPATAENCFNITISPKPVWKTITIGIFKSFFELRSALDNAGIAVGDLADEILARPSFEPSKLKTKFDLTIYTANELGVEEGWALQSEIYARARCLGLRLCATEIAPLLRLSYRDQKLNEVINVAMEARKTYDGELVILSLAHFATGVKGKSLMLLGHDGRPEAKMPSTMPFVFVQPGLAIVEK